MIGTTACVDDPRTHERGLFISVAPICRCRFEATPRVSHMWHIWNLFMHPYLRIYIHTLAQLKLVSSVVSRAAT